MKSIEKELIDLIINKVKVELDDCGEIDNTTRERIVKNIEKIRKYRIKDFNAALSYFKNIVFYMKESGEFKREEQRYIMLKESKRLLEDVIDVRRDRNSSISKVDTNLITHYPYFVGGSKKRKKKALEEGYILIEKGGVKKVTYENKQGLMVTMKDAMTLFALFSIWEKQGYREWIRFTEYQILDTLRLNHGGKQYEMIRRSLEKLWNTTVVMQEAYDVETGKREVTKRFSLIVADRVTKEYSKNGDLRSKNYAIKFSEYIRTSMKWGHYSLISLAVLNDLDSDTAKGIYLLMVGINDMDRNQRYVRKGGRIEIELQEVYNTLFLESSKYRNKELVEKGCEELKDMEVIDDFHFKYKGKQVDKLVIHPSTWQLDMMRKKEELISKQGNIDAGQINFRELKDD